MGRIVPAGSRKGIGGRQKAADPSVVVRLPRSLATAAKRAAAASMAHGGGLGSFLDVEARTAMTIPHMSCKVPAGFPSPADDYLQRPLDFNELILVRPAATIAVTVDGDSMIGAGIFHGDIAVVDRSVTPTHNCIVVAIVSNEYTLKRYCCRDGQCWLKAENPNYPDMPLTEMTPFEVWGVVTRTVRLF